MLFPIGLWLDPKNMALLFSDQLWNSVGLHFNCTEGIDQRKTSEIYLSVRYHEKPEELRDTLLHELCHATVWQINQQQEEDAHGPEWQWWVQHVGFMHPDIPKLTVVVDYVGDRYLYKCMDCGYDITAKKSFPFIRRRCLKCGYRWQRLIPLYDPDLLEVVNA